MTSHFPPRMSTPNRTAPSLKGWVGPMWSHRLPFPHSTPSFCDQSALPILWAKDPATRGLGANQLEPMDPCTHSNRRPFACQAELGPRIQMRLMSDPRVWPDDLHMVGTDEKYTMTITDKAINQQHNKNNSYRSRRQCDRALASQR